MPSASAGREGPAADTQAVSSRKLRKRELDRNAQRNARERTKNRIAYLERLVEDLRHENTGGPVARLMEQLSDVKQERDDLSKAMRAIENVLKTTRVLGTGAMGVCLPPVVICSDTRTDSSPEGAALQAETPPTSASPDNASKVEEPDDIIIPINSECDCSAEKSVFCQPGSINRWRFANEVLSGAPKLPPDVLGLEDATAEDTPVRAMIEGWDAVEASGRLPPLWQKLRRIDEVIFPSCSKVERLAIMRLMHLLYRYHAGPTETRKADIPSWYLHRPSQDSIPHSYAINFFAWPGLRERFIFSQHKYCSNDFWRLLSQCTVVLWPFEFRDCYTYNVETGHYAMSGAFDKRIRDINCWTMKSDLYERWPEMRSDIPAYREIARSLSDPQYDTNEEQQLVTQEPIGNLWPEAHALGGSWSIDFPGGSYADGTTFVGTNFYSMLPGIPSSSFPHPNNRANTDG